MFQFPMGIRRFSTFLLAFNTPQARTFQFPMGIRRFSTAPPKTSIILTNYNSVFEHLHFSITYPQAKFYTYYLTPLNYLNLPYRASPRFSAFPRCSMKMDFN